MNFPVHMAQLRRRDILRLLAASSGYSSNESLLKLALRQQGYTVAGEQLRADLAWLSEHHLVTTRELGGVVIATVLELGVDAAAGAVDIAGVARPDPER